MARIERESDMRREKQTCLGFRNQRRAWRMAQASAEKLKHTELAEKE